jgi:hypothetical protein
LVFWREPEGGENGVGLVAGMKPRSRRPVSALLPERQRFAKDAHRQPHPNVPSRLYAILWSIAPKNYIQTQ